MCGYSGCLKLNTKIFLTTVQLSATIRGSCATLINVESNNVLITVWNVKLAVGLHCVNEAEEVGNEIESKQHFLVVVTEMQAVVTEMK